MRKVTLRESQAPYILTIDAEITTNESVLLERHGKPVAALIPIADFNAFQAWRKTLDEIQSEGDEEALAAVARIGSMFPPLDLATADYIATNDELALDYMFALDNAA